MRIGQVNQGRPTYYDRNPVNVTTRYSAAGVAPHGSTNRITYTVPTNTKAFLAFVVANSRRDTVAAPAAVQEIETIYQTQGGIPIYLLHPSEVNNTTPHYTEDVISPQMAMFAGDQLFANDNDQSTGGTYSYNEAFAITQYDN